MVEVFVVLNNVSSPQRLIDTAKVTYSANMSFVKGFIAVKVTGMAAQTGVPEVSRLAYKLNKTFIVLPTIKDAMEILKPTKTVMLVDSEVSEDLSNLEISGNDRILLIVSGVENGFTKAELGLGTPVTIKEFTQLPPAPATAIALYILKNKIETQTKPKNPQNKP